MTYKIIRYQFYGESKVIKKGLTLEEAREHCNDPKTEGIDWFDGYTKEEVEPTFAMCDGDCGGSYNVEDLHTANTIAQYKFCKPCMFDFVANQEQEEENEEE